MNISLHRPGSNQNGSSHNAASKLYGRLASFGNFVEKGRDKKEAVYSPQSSFSSFASEDLDDIHHDCKQGKIHQTMEHSERSIIGIGRPVDVDTESNDADVTCYHTSTPPSCEPSLLMYVAETNKTYCISEDSIKPKRGTVGRSKSFDHDQETMTQVTEPPKRSLGPRSISFSARGASKKSQHVAPVSSKKTDQSTHLSDVLERSDSSTQQLRRSMKKSPSFRERKGEGEKQKRRMSESAAAKHCDEDDKVGLQRSQESPPTPSVSRSIPDVNLGSIAESNLRKTFENSRRDTRRGLLKKSVSFHGCKSPQPADHGHKEGNPFGLSASSKKNKLFQGELFEAGASCAIIKEKKEGSMRHALVIGENTEKELENAMSSTLHLTRSKSGSDLNARGAEELSRGIGRVKSFSTGLKKREESSRGVGFVKSNSTECHEKKNRSKGKSKKLSSGSDHTHNSSKGKSKLLPSSSDGTHKKRSSSPRKTRCCSPLERSDDLRQSRRLSTGSVTLLPADNNLYSKTPACTSGPDHNTYQLRSSSPSRTSDHDLRQGRRRSTGSNAQQLLPAVVVLGPKQHDSSILVDDDSGVDLFRCVTSLPTPITDGYSYNAFLQLDSTGSVTLLPADNNLYSKTPACTSGSDHNTHQLRSSSPSRASDHDLRQGRRLSTGSNAQQLLPAVVLGPQQHDSSIMDDDSGVDLFRYVTRVPPQTTDGYSYNAFLQLDWGTISGSVCVS